MKNRIVAVLSVLLATGVFVGATAQAANKPITIYTDQYAGNEAISRVAQQLIESHFDTRVELKTVSVGVSFVGTSNDDRGMFMGVWLPRTHEDYMQRVKDDVVNLGIMYKGARLGWAVPSYVPEDQLASFSDLNKPEVKEKLGSRIQGISAGAGEMRLSKQALKDYALDDYTLTTASGAAMTAQLKRAIDRNDWIVVTAWSPHWMWVRYDLRYLDDPKQALGETETVEAIANPKLVDSEPEIMAFMKRMEFTLDQVNNMAADANDTSYDAAGERFIKDNPDLVKSWIGSK